MSITKEIIDLMQHQIAVLNEEIQNSKEIYISDIVGLVVSLLDKLKNHEISFRVEDKTQGPINCDICDFESENEKTLTSHMINDHEDCYSYYLCNKYFKK